MARSFVLKSASDDGRLELSCELDADPPGYEGYAIDARFTRHDLHVAVAIDDIEHRHWAPFFDDLAAAWDGWNGARRNVSAYETLAMEATNDGCGHIRLVVELRDRREWSWRVFAVIVVEAGQLGAVADRARAFFR